MAHPPVPETTCGAPNRDAVLSFAHLAAFVPGAARHILVCAGSSDSEGALLKSRGARFVAGLLDTTAGSPGDGFDAVAQGPLDFTPIPGADTPFDCILCHFALERLRNPETFVQTLADRMAPGGLLLGTVPNMQYHKIVCALTEGRWAYGQSGVWDRKNLRFFTAREAKVLLESAGLGNVKVSSLVKDSDSVFPRDPAGLARSGRLRIGPLDDAAYQAWLTEYYLVLAVRPN
jgi:hypothetical protein